MYIYISKNLFIVLLSISMITIIHSCRVLLIIKKEVAQEVYLHTICAREKNKF